MNDLAAFISSKIHIDRADLEVIVSHFKQKTIDKGKLLLKRGQVATQYYYLVSGGVRFYYGEATEQLTAWVVFGNEFFTEISSLNPQTPTRFNIEAIEETTVCSIDKADMEKLYKQYPAWQEFGRITWENMAMRMIDEIIRFQTMTAEERYLEFLKIPGFLQRVPVKQLASYLGITPNALSRIRKNIR
jgi:CRP-like cAMP-binding protein